MKKLYYFLFSFFSLTTYAQDLIITGIFDGPLSGGVPKTIELYVINNISDLGVYGIGSANNGGGSDGIEFVLSGAASAGDFIYIASESAQFNAYFGFDPDFVSGAASINGDDAIELFDNVVDGGGGNFTGTVIDTYGVINVNGDGEVWDYTDGWAYRKNNTGAGGTSFNSNDWSFSGIDVNDGQTSNGSSSTPFPLGTYTSSTASVDKDKIIGFTVYPNPVTEGNLFVKTQLNNEKQVDIFDVLGKKVLSRRISANYVDVSSLKSGVYILKVTENNKTAARKLVIK